MVFGIQGLGGVGLVIPGSPPGTETKKKLPYGASSKMKKPKRQCINIEGMKQARGAHWNLGILGGDAGGEYWGVRPQYWLIGPPRIPPSRFRGSSVLVHPWPVSYSGYLYAATCSHRKRPIFQHVRKPAWHSLQISCAMIAQRKPVS